MSAPAILTALCLVTSAVVSIVSLLREKPEDQPGKPKRKYLKWLLYFLAVASLVVGLIQIRAASVEQAQSEAKHEREQGIEEGKIDSLKKENRKQYERHQLELKSMHDELSSLKTDFATVDLRKKLAAYEERLAASMAPKPKAKLDVSFYEPGMKIGEIRKAEYAHADGDVFSFSFFVQNNSGVNADHAKVWIRICQECKYHIEPPGATKVAGAQDFERLYTNLDVPAGVAYQKLDVEVEMPSRFTSMPAMFSYRCDDCESEPEWQRLDVNVGRLTPPQFSNPATVPKKTVKH